jgi:hypothetical protein
LAEVENAVVSLIEGYKNTAHLLRNPRIFEETEESAAKIRAEEARVRHAGVADIKVSKRQIFIIFLQWVFTTSDVWLLLLELVYMLIVRVPKEMYSGNFGLILLQRRMIKNVDQIVAVCNLYHSLEKDTKKKDSVSKVINELTRGKGEIKREKEESTPSRIQNLLGSLSAAATVVTLIFGEQISNYLSQVFPNASTSSTSGLLSFFPTF